jgi:hypothetical protein
VTPPSEDVKIVKTLTLLSDATMDLTPESIVEAYAHIKIRREIPVSEEFINLQLKYHINESYVCLNNPCICNLSFWKKIYDENVCCRSKIINNDLLYNDSFKKNFIPKVEDIPLYEQNSDGISWRTISSARCIPYAFLKAFKSKMHPARWLSREVLGSLNEEQLEYIFTNEQTGEMEKLPENILFFNRNLSYKFIASHLLDIYGLYGYNDRRGSHLYHIKLTELVGALA